MDQLGDETEARRVRNSTGALYRKDRVSQSGPDAGHVMAESVRALVFDRTLALKVTGC